MSFRHRRALALVAAGVSTFLAFGSLTASAHNDPCHSRHACPSDHHTYVWVDSTTGRSWNCAEPGAREYDPARDTTTIVFAGLTYHCRAAIGAATATASSSTKTPPGSEVRVTKAAVRIAKRQLARLRVRPAGTMAGYSRARFGPAWADVNHNDCNTRDDILHRDLRLVVLKSGSDCTVASGVLHDPYTGKTIRFLRGIKTSLAVQIDHVVALGDAWRSGAARWTAAKRLLYANDPVVLLAVDGHTNEAKGDDDASQWLPPRKAYDCPYVVKQITIKTKYRLWVTRPEHNAMAGQLAGC